MSDTIAVRPHRGYLTHVMRDRPNDRAQMRVGMMVMYGRPLCGQRIREGFLVVGTPAEPTPVAEALTRPGAHACGACARKVRA